MQFSAVILIINRAMRISEVGFHRFGLGALKKTAKASNADHPDGQVIFLTSAPAPGFHPPRFPDRRFEAPQG